MSLRNEAQVEAESRGYGKFNRDFQNGFVQGAEWVQDQVKEVLILHPVCGSDYCGYREAVDKLSEIVGW